MGRVRLAYLDPPFNTQQSFLHYDDALEHSVWLTMMRDRLQQIRQLLSADGTVWVHLDDSEMAYCRMLMDELFGRENFIATIVWEKSDSPRNTAKYFSTDQDYLLVYARDAEQARINRLPRTDAANEKYTNPDADPRGPWFGDNLRANKPYSLGQYVVTGPTGRDFRPPPGKFWRNSEARFQELDEDDRIWWGAAGDAFPTGKRFLSDVGDLVPRTIWSHAEAGSNRTSRNEVKALFPGVEQFATPKPEALVQRIVELGSDVGDIVLDCFAGSGTTGAVAHKLRRRWVLVERETATMEAYTKPRLQMVVTGTDSGGISKSVAWTGGGGYRVLSVASSMFEEDGGTVVLSDWATNGQLAEATAAQLGYDYTPDPPFCGAKGRKRLAVVDGMVSPDVVRLLVEALEEDQRLTICGTAFDPEARPLLKSLRPGSTLRKVPSSILDEYKLRMLATSGWPELPLSREDSAAATVAT